MDLKENMKTERGSWEQGISQSSKNLAEASKVSIYKVNNIKIKYSKLVHVSRCHRVFWILHNKTTLNHVKPLPWQFSQEWVWPSSWDSPWHWCWLPVLNLSPLASLGGFSPTTAVCNAPVRWGEESTEAVTEQGLPICTLFSCRCRRPANHRAGERNKAHHLGSHEEDEPKSRPAAPKSGVYSEHTYFVLAYRIFWKSASGAGAITYGLIIYFESMSTDQFHYITFTY